ncbi:hypothetical protein EDB83DRAFT_2322191 [Lactarius deliciosus]|nr:hypothetical protein EDB83DRAFT_2322191 [Lactarius deliciosus]
MTVNETMGPQIKLTLARGLGTRAKPWKRAGLSPGAARAQAEACTSCRHVIPAVSYKQWWWGEPNEQVVRAGAATKTTKLANTMVMPSSLAEYLGQFGTKQMKMRERGHVAKGGGEGNTVLETETLETGNDGANTTRLREFPLQPHYIKPDVQRLPLCTDPTGLLLHVWVVDLDALEGCLYRSPDSIYSKILATSVRYKPKVFASQIWNAIAIAGTCCPLTTCRSFFITRFKTRLTRWPAQSPCSPFFIAQTDKGIKGSFQVFPPGSEAERRISFFAQLLTTALPDALLVDAKPDYNEKWENFVRDTKILAQESEMYDGTLRAAPSDERSSSELHNLPFYCIGFKSAAPELTLHTCFDGNTDKLERKLKHMAHRKFKFVVCMQRYSKFNKEEHENAEFSLRAYPEL